MSFNPMENPGPMRKEDFHYKAHDRVLSKANPALVAADVVRANTASTIFSGIEYTFYDIAKSISDRKSLEIICEKFENLLSKEKIEEILSFVESLRK